MDFAIESAADLVLLDFKVEMVLQVQPELSGSAKVPAEAKRRVGRDGACAVHDLVDTTCWNTDVLGQAILRDLHGRKKLFVQHLSRVYGCHFFHVC